MRERMETGIQHLPISKSIFDVVGSGVDEHPTLIPGPGLHADVLVDRTQVLQLLVTDRDGCKERRGEAEKQSNTLILFRVDQIQDFFKTLTL